MKIYWTLKSIPEISQLPSPERGKRWRSAYRLTFRHWETWAGMALCGLSAGAGAYFFATPGQLLMGGLGGLIYGNVSVYVARKYYRQQLMHGAF